MVKGHLPKGRWTRERLESLPWRQLAAIARYPYRRSKAAAKRRIHKLERRKAARDIEEP